ncbi:MAG TPA: hypothetical protein VHG91_07360 [Longimicrobium sp.]|nr:hypothetical protein [Longimicrobium sp.]
MSLFTTTPDFLVREADGDYRPAGTLVLGRGLRVADTAGGIPELLPGSAAETVLVPSGGDDAGQIQAALNTSRRVRLAQGTFTVGSTLLLPSGTTLAGSGTGATQLRVTHNGAGIVTAVGALLSTIESLRLTGPGKLVGSGTGIVASGGDPGPETQGIALRDLAVEEFGGSGVYATNVGGFVMRDVAVHRVRYTGVHLAVTGGGSGRWARLDHVSVSECTDGLIASAFSLITLSDVGFWTLTGNAVNITGGAQHVLSAVRVGGAVNGIWVNGAGVAALDGCMVTECVNGFLVQSVTGATLDACRAAGCSGTPLTVRGSVSVSVDAFVSDQAGSASTQPHLLVDGSATLVTVTSFRRVNPATPPTWEVDVTAAGGRVVFIQHNFDPARTNSGGRFVAL